MFTNTHMISSILTLKNVNNNNFDNVSKWKDLMEL